MKPVISSFAGDHENRATNVAASRRRRLGKRLRYLGGVSMCAWSSAVGAQTGSVTLAWDPVPQLDVSGYILYYGTSSRSYSNFIDLGDVTFHTVSGLVRGVTYFFALTDYNALGAESAFSDEIAYRIPLNPPVKILSATPQLQGDMRIVWESESGSVYRVACKNNLSDANWTDLSNDIVATAMTTSWTDKNASRFPYRFYRVRSL